MSALPSPLKLVARGPKGASAELPLTSATTFGELLEACNTRLGLKLGPDELGSRLRVLSGFPPRPLALGTGDAISSCVRHQESIRVEVRADAASSQAANPAAVVPAPKGKGKAAGGAKPPPAKSKPAAASKLSAPSKRPAPGGGPNIRTIGGGGGGGVSRSASSSSSFSSPSPPKRRRAIAMGGSEAELGATLVGAQGSEGGKDGAFWRRVMSNAVRSQYESTKAVDRVTASRSGVFTASADPDGGRTADGTHSARMVWFPKQSSFTKARAAASGTSGASGGDGGDGGAGCGGCPAGWHEDRGLDALSGEQAVAVVREILSDPADRDMLKPENMALCSPRVFWALLLAGGGRDLPATLQYLLPDTDWAFLTVRVRKQSEKALENARQLEASAGRERRDADEDGGADGGDAGEEGKNGDETAHAGGEGAASATAAAATVGRVAGTAVAATRTPRELVLAAAERRAAEAKSPGSDGAAPALTSGPASVSSASVSSAAVLTAEALGGSEASLKASLGASLEAIVGAAWARALAAGPLTASVPGSVPGSVPTSLAALADADDAAALASALAPRRPPAAEAPSEAVVAGWISAAREHEGQRALEDILAVTGTEGSREGVVCPGGVLDSPGAIAAALSDALRCRTVRDLKLWVKRPPFARTLIAKHLAKHDGGGGSGGLGAIESAVALALPDGRMRAWFAAAEAATAQRPWLDDWISGVGGV